ncbi:MAG: tol-pal system protein YbgF [Proteobacteria bacterium]|nr:tol-pal system protein YbgF [Pseudomonadota bacterium]
MFLTPTVRLHLLLAAFFLALLPAAAPAQEDIRPGGPPMALAPPMPQVSATDLQMRLNALETQLRNVTGELERVQYLNNQLQQNIQRMNADMDGRFHMLEQRVGAQESSPRPSAPIASPVGIPPSSPSPITTMPTPGSPPPTQVQGAIDAPEPLAEPSPHVLGTLSSQGPPPGDPQALYDQAFQSLRQARYDEAESRLHDFLKNFPKHKLAENAHYWLGETYYVRGKFQEAAVTFAEGFQNFPKGTKAPDNLLKLAMSLGSIDKKKDACDTLAALKQRFPNASAIIRNRAEQEKKNLACT